MADEANCYLLKSGVVVGNCALFWREGGCGYTTALGDAGLYRAEDATPDSVAVPRELAEELAKRHVDRDQLLTRLAKLQDGG